MTTLDKALEQVRNLSAGEGGSGPELLAAVQAALEAAEKNRPPAAEDRDRLERLAEGLGQLSVREPYAPGRQARLEELIRCLEIIWSAAEAADAGLGLKLASAYLTLALEYDRKWAEAGLKLAETLGAAAGNRSEPAFLQAQFHLLLGDREQAERCYNEAMAYSREQPPLWPGYSFHLPLPTKDRALFGHWPSWRRLTADQPAMRAYLGLPQGPAPARETPYSQLPSETKFWRSAVARRMPPQMTGLYRKKFGLDKKTKIISLGSCFAQHIGAVLKAEGFNFLDYEPPFTRAHYWAAPPKNLAYGLYSARYGNIYTVRQLRQLFLRAFDRFSPLEEFWLDGERWYDPFRPTIEPKGYYSLPEARLMRRTHLEAVRRLFLEAELMIFTLGLTEAWVHRGDGAVYPLCPGAAAGAFDAETYEFKNFSYREIIEDLELLLADLKAINPALKLILTVSPVPLTATYSDDHVLVATMRSKAVLRAAAQEIYETCEQVDYFPSYDVISSIPFARGAFQENMRTVKPEVVRYIMSVFLSAHGYCLTDPASDPASDPAAEPASMETRPGPAEEQCDEALLEAFEK